MNISEPYKIKTNCDCGKKHSCDIRYISIKAGAIEELPGLFAGFSHIVLVADVNTYAVCGVRVTELIADKLESKMVFECESPLVPDEESVRRIDSIITSKTDLIVGVGSGVINDLCKYVSFNHNLQYYIIATAPSMDGYASAVAAMITNKMKTTFNTHVPTAVIGDVDILKNAPMRMIQSGFGDIIGKYSALNDWKLAHLITGEQICQYVYDLTYQAILKTERLADGILKRDPHAIQNLMEALIITGIAMSFTGDSRPASGSEHHFSHYFEITGLIFDREYFLHGIDVAYSTVSTGIMREKILSYMTFPNKTFNFNRKEWIENIRRNYGSAADGVIVLQDKCKYYEKDYALVYREKWEDIRGVLAEMPSWEYIKNILHKVGLDFSEFEELYGEALIEDCKYYAKDLKDRYTFLWIYYILFAEKA